MISTCPSCLNQVEHEDHLFEVECECGTRFNPFLGTGDLPPLNEMGIGDMGGAAPATTATPMPEAAPGTFQESNALFQELRDFGEGLGQNQSGEISDGPLTPEAPPPAPPNAPQASKSSKPASKTATPQLRVVTAAEGDLLVTAGDSLPGFQIESWLPPLSLWSDLGGDENPMKPAFDLLWNQAQQSGANAVLGVRWALSPDGGRVLMSGHPARVVKS